jgi:hypothetical protein
VPPHNEPTPLQVVTTIGFSDLRSKRQRGLGDAGDADRVARFRLSSGDAARPAVDSAPLLDQAASTAGFSVSSHHRRKVVGVWIACWGVRAIPVSNPLSLAVIMSTSA